jgi:hypothetical protein
MSDSSKSAGKGTEEYGTVDPATGNPAVAGRPDGEPVVLKEKPASQVEGEQLGAEADEHMREANLSREARDPDEASEHAAKAQAQHEKDNPPPG